MRTTPSLYKTFCSLAFALTAFVAATLSAQEVVELPLPNSNQVVIKLQFRNGSIADPVGKEGLTEATASLVAEGGTRELNYSAIQEAIYPMAAQYSVNVDKEVTVFTFQVHRDLLAKFYPI